MDPCFDAQMALDARLEAELAEYAEAALSAHIADCPPCGEIGQNLDSLHSMLLADEPEAFPEELHFSILSRIHSERRSQNVFRRAAIAAAVLLSAAVAGWHLDALAALWQGALALPAGASALLPSATLQELPSLLPEISAAGFPMSASLSLPAELSLPATFLILLPLLVLLNVFALRLPEPAHAIP